MQSRARPWRSAALLLLAVITAACFATQASALKFPPNGLRFFADVGISPPPSRSLITVDSIRGSLRVVSIRGVHDVRAAVPTGSAGKAVGRLSLGTSGTSAGKRLKLTMPSRTSASKLILARDGRLSVVLRPSGRHTTIGSGGANNVILSIHGLPTGTTSVTVTFDGAGRGVLGTTHGCPVKPTLNLYAVRDGASPVSVNSRISCGTPPK